MGAEVLTVPLRDVIVGSTFIPTRSIDPRINAIDLGVFGETAEEIIADTIADPQHPEIGKMVYATRDGKVLLQRDRTVAYGNLIQGEIRVEVETLTGRMEDAYKIRACAALIHSHRGHDLPPSPVDLAGLFYPSQEVAAQTLVFVVTPVQKYLVFRGLCTPFWDRGRTQRQVDGWIENVGKAVLPYQYSARTQAELDGINGRIQYEQLKDICHEHQLVFFSCPTSKNVAYKHSA